MMDTIEVLLACQRGLRNKDPTIRAAAESVLSYLTPRIKRRRVQLPQELWGRFKLLEHHLFTD